MLGNEQVNPLILLSGHRPLLMVSCAGNCVLEPAVSRTSSLFPVDTTSNNHKSLETSSLPINIPNESFLASYKVL